jgi:hypothetical protein
VSGKDSRRRYINGMARREPAFRLRGTAGLFFPRRRIMAHALKAHSSRIGHSSKPARDLLAYPKWLTKAVIYAGTEVGSASIDERHEPASFWRLRLEPNKSDRTPKRRTLASPLPLPGRFYFGNRQLPFGLAPSTSRAFVFWLPSEIDISDLHLIACSRLPRNLHDHPLLIDAIRSVAEGLTLPSATLLYSPRFTLASHLRAISQKLQVPLLSLSSIPSRANEAWFRNNAKQSRSPLGPKLFFCCPLEGNLADNILAELPADSPLAVIADQFTNASAVPESLIDWLAVHIAHRVNVISLRPGGNLEAAVSDCLSGANHNPLRVRILNAPQFTPSGLVDQLVQAGATRWTIAPPPSSVSSRGSFRPEQNETASSSPLICDSQPLGDFLFHWTRAAELNRQGAADQYLTKLLAASQRARISIQEFVFNDSPQDRLERLLKTLLQILAEMRLRASGRWTRDHRPVVSLTAQPLANWPEFRSFRAHLGRWDFEPCGLGLSREVILHLGGRPVIYGDELTYRELAGGEQTYFQLNCSRGPHRLIDWTTEREWRVPDDIDLRLFGVQDAFVFVPNRKAAETAARFSRWPVYSLDGKTPLL